MLLEDRVAIVAGVGPGLGRSSALGLAREGAHIVLGARTRRTLEGVAEEIEALGRQALVVPTDITKPEDTQAIANGAIERFGRIDILVNNAGWSGNMLPILEMPVEDFRSVVEGNLVGTMAMCKHVAQYMVRAKSGSIINVTSISMRQGLVRRGPYGASKAGVTVMTQTLARELGKYGVRVNSVAPGPIWSDKLDSFYHGLAEKTGRTYDDILQVYTKNLPLGKIPQPDEVAQPIVFLATDWAAGITGQSLDASGGFYFH